MASIKTKTKKALPRVARTAKSIAKRNVGASRDEAMKYVVPAAAAAVGTGVLVGGYLMRSKLSGTARTAKRAAGAMAKQANFNGLLDLIGMQRRRGIWATALPAFGILAAGLLVGSAFAAWLSPEIKTFLQKAAETNHVPTGSDFLTGSSGISEHPRV